MSNRRGASGCGASIRQGYSSIEAGQLAKVLLGQSYRHRNSTREKRDNQAMAPLTRPARKQTISDGSAYIRSPVSGHPSREALPFSQRYGGAPGSPGGSTSTAAGWASGLLHARRRVLLRSVGGGGTLVFAFFGLLLYFGAFDPNPRIGSNIHPYTYQVMPVGDPWARKGIDYTRPPGYWEYMANWNAPSTELAANSPPSTRKCHSDGPLLL